MGGLQIVLHFPAYPHCKLIQFNINPYVVQSLSYSFFCLLTLSSSNKTLPPPIIVIYISFRAGCVIGCTKIYNYIYNNQKKQK